MYARAVPSHCRSPPQQCLLGREIPPYSAPTLTQALRWHPSHHHPLSSPRQPSEAGSDRLGSRPMPQSSPARLCICPSPTHAWRRALKTPLNVPQAALSPSLPPTPKAQSCLFCTRIMTTGAEQGRGANCNYCRRQCAFQTRDVFRASLEPCNQRSPCPHLSRNEGILDD